MTFHPKVFKKKVPRYLLRKITFIWALPLILIFTSFESSGLCHQGFCPGCNVSPSRVKPTPHPSLPAHSIKIASTGYTPRLREPLWKSFSLHKITMQRSRPVWNSPRTIRHDQPSAYHVLLVSMMKSYAVWTFTSTANIMRDKLVLNFSAKFQR